ncbi:MAG TPA: 4-(cytidine 5'-diphospho)-2-C-methyl-D-erythritol kinase [Fimbriimonadaceae bacterium]
MEVIVQCPAKINEFLLVGEQDSRGYHPIKTVFQAVGLFDELSISQSSADVFVSDVDLPEDNTVVKAWNLLKEFVHMMPLEVVLKKRIPSMSGLGGGSSDAAGFLRGVRPFLYAQPQESDFMEVAKAVGADVPFFLVGGRARGEGYGETLTPLIDESNGWVVLAMPRGATCSTAEMYQRLDALPRSLDRLESGNDFEPVAPAECLDLIVTLKELGAKQGALTGSGSAVFGRFDSQSEAGEAANGLGEGIWARVVRTLTREESLS